MGWITKNGKHIYIPDNDEPIVSKHTGDVITRQMALDSWERNASSIKLASQGEIYDPKEIFNKISFNDEAKAEQLINFVSGHTSNIPLYRGISNLSDEDYAKYTKVGSVITEKGLSSWSTDKGTAHGHGMYGKGITFIKDTPTPNARSVGQLAADTGEDEVIVYNNKARVKKVKKGKYTTFVYLQ